MVQSQRSWSSHLPVRVLSRFNRVRLRIQLGLTTWRRSLRVRVAATTVIVGMVALLSLGMVLSGQVRDSLYQGRVGEILSDAAVRASNAQSNFDSAEAARVQDVQQLAYDVVDTLHVASTASAGVLLLRSPGSTSQFPEPVTDSGLRLLITPELREAVQSEHAQQWQPASIAGEPGLVVGTVVTLPLAGEYELYFVYGLADEQATLDLLQGVLSVGAIVLVVLLLVMAWYLTRQVLTPVQQVAQTAQRLADGLLDERIPVRGVDELAVLARSFNEMAQSLTDQIEKLEELSQMQQQFVSDVSHELRTPLTTIRIASEVLHRGRDDFSPDQARSAELLATQLDRFEALLADLLEISRFDAGAATLDVEEADLAVVVERVTDIAAPLAAQRGSKIRTQLPSTPVRVDMDTRRVERIVRNLLINAVEHGEGNPIDVIVAADDRAVSLVVRDYGLGMTAAHAERVFDRFWRADPARTRTLGGTGLGLAISLEDARLHGGTLQAWGSPGEGASFRLTLPVRAGLQILEHPLQLHPVRQVADPARVDDPAGPQALPDALLGQAQE
ncbi:MAG: MtrAB system histidine kinase MtrB [Beutenbergiaceae bacterium]